MAISMQRGERIVGGEIYGGFLKWWYPKMDGL